MKQSKKATAEIEGKIHIHIITENGSLAAQADYNDDNNHKLSISFEFTNEEEEEAEVRTYVCM